MNKKQVGFLFGKGKRGIDEYLPLSLAAFCGYEAVNSLGYALGYDFLDRELAIGVANGMMSIYLGKIGIRYGLTRGLSQLQLKKIRTGRKTYPIQHAERVIFDDVEGLEFLLAKTHDGENIEWGTLIKAHDDNGRAVVHDILDINLAKELGLIGNGTESKLMFDVAEAEEEGFNGLQHYHPNGRLLWYGASNFSINLVDRFRPLDWINLLTFNMPEGPEIIGFNRQYLYIPADESRRELVRATPRQVMEYLAA